MPLLPAAPTTLLPRAPFPLSPFSIESLRLLPLRLRRHSPAALTCSPIRKTVMRSFLRPLLASLLFLILSFPSPLIAGKEGRNTWTQTPPTECVESINIHNPLFPGQSSQKEIHDGSNNDDLGIWGASVSYAANCNVKPPKGSYESWATMTDALKVAFQDAITLAQGSANLPVTSVA
jgi:hypothetical protein